MTEPVNVWWTRVPVAGQKVRQARNALLEGKSVRVLPDMVWLDAFIELVVEKVKNRESGFSYDRIDCSAFDGSCPLLDSLVRMFHLESAYDGSLRSILPALADSSGSIWHLRRLLPTQRNEAYRLVKEAKACPGHKIRFLLEDEFSTTSSTIESIFLAPTHLDIQYYIWTLLLENGKGVSVEYASACAAELCKGDPKHCLEFYEDVGHALAAPGEVCGWLDPQELEHAILIAQVKCIEPKIEMGRQQLIERLGDRVERFLPFEDEYHNTFTHPREVELRHLWHFYNTLSLSADEARILTILYNGRNSIAHLKPLEYSKVNEILSLESID